MKRYESIGELLIDYREVNDFSQAEFADKINVDTRTIQRWERGETLVKSEKEEEIVVETFMPYQLIRNLNSAIVIPTYYDFRIRKYSLNELSNEVPDAIWFKKTFNSQNNNIRLLDFKFDFDYLKRFLNFQREVSGSILETIKRATELLPELNLIITDDSGYYSGHSIMFPIKYKTYEKLLNKEISEDEITANDLVDFRKEKKPVFYNYEITADCNFDMYYLIHRLLRFINGLSDTDYIYAAYATRYDTFNVNEQIGFKVLWEEEPTVDKLGFKIFPRFYAGDFKAYLADSNF